MESVRCPECGLLHWKTDHKCKRCGCSLVLEEIPANVAAETVDAPPTIAVGARPAPWVDRRQAQPANISGKKKIGLAVFSLVAGIMCVPPLFSFVLLIVGGVLALVFGVGGFIAGAVLALGLMPAALATGIVAVKRTNAQPEQYGGKGLAIAGISCSGTGLAVIPLIAAIAIPNLLTARRAANEGSAIQNLRTLNTAQATYMSTVGEGNCGELAQLRSTGLVDEKLATGVKSGYKFELAFDDQKHKCFAYATPENSSTGTRSFLLAHDGVIHAGNKKGARAELKDPALEN